MTEPQERTEEQQERLNRQLSEVLQELRIAMPGVQVLFAFLLAVPFATGFEKVNAFQRDVYLFALLAAAVSSALLIAPTAYHRMMFQRGDKEAIIEYATRGALLGLTFLALSMTACVLFVVSFLFDDRTAAVAAGFVGLLFGVLWFALGWFRRTRSRRHHDTDVPDH